MSFFDDDIPPDDPNLDGEIQSAQIIASIFFALAGANCIVCTAAAGGCCTDGAAVDLKDERWTMKGRIHNMYMSLDPRGDVMQIPRSNARRMMPNEGAAPLMTAAVQGALANASMPQHTPTASPMGAIAGGGAAGGGGGIAEIQANILQRSIACAHAIPELDTPPNPSIEVLSHNSQNMWDTPALRGSALACNPFVFMWIGLALWPWAKLAERCLIDAAGDRSAAFWCRGDLEDAGGKVTGFAVVAALFGLVMVYRACSSTADMSKVKTVSEFAKNYCAVSNVGASGPSYSVTVAASWRASHSTGSGKNRRTVTTGRGQFRWADLPGLPPLSLTGASTTMEDLTAALASSGAPSAYVYTRVVMVPLGRARLALGVAKTALQAYAAATDTRFHTNVDLGLRRDDGQVMRTGSTIGSTHVVLDGSDLDSAKATLHPCGCFPSFLRPVATFVMAASGTMSCCLARTQAKIPEVVLTIIKYVHLAQDNMPAEGRPPMPGPPMPGPGVPRKIGSDQPMMPGAPMPGPGVPRKVGSDQPMMPGASQPMGMPAGPGGPMGVPARATAPPQQVPFGAPAHPAAPYPTSDPNGPPTVHGMNPAYGGGGPPGAVAPAYPAPAEPYGGVGVTAAYPGAAQPYAGGGVAAAYPGPPAYGGAPAAYPTQPMPNAGLGNMFGGAGGGVGPPPTYTF